MYKSVVIFVLLFVTLHALPNACPFIYSPVCGLYRATNMCETFPNKCVLDYNRDFSYFHSGDCDPKKCSIIPVAKACTLDYRPVCGAFGLSLRCKTFPNMCSLTNTPGFSRIHNGVCDPNKCHLMSKPRIAECPDVHQPVCAWIGKSSSCKTFQNKCVLEKAGALYQLKHEGKCDPKTSGCAVSEVGSLEQCSDAIKPVCAHIGFSNKCKTFQNKCFLKKAGSLYQLKHEGKCDPKSSGCIVQDQRALPCDAYKPVCASIAGSNQCKTFKNVCALFQAGKLYGLKHEGKCDPKTSGCIVIHPENINAWYPPKNGVIATPGG